MKIRRATEADEAVLRELWEECEREVLSPPPSPEPQTWEVEWVSVRANVADGAVYLAEDDEGVAGVVEASAPVRGRAHVVLVYVRPRARRQGVAKALLAECVRDSKEKGASLVSLDVLTTNTVGRAVWQQLGFMEVQLAMATPLDVLERRLAAQSSGTSRSSTHVQSDDSVSIERALAQFVPRLDSAEVRSTPNGWIRIADPLLDTDREAQGRLAKDISERIGGVVVALALEVEAVVRFRLYENGRMVDEYLSVPTFYGELPKGDVLALEANPTLVARLTGADREQVRRNVRTAISPADLPPAAELYEQVAALMGLEA
ncbi:MAG TPA: GNAT family N-acetyltransferase [Gaiellaceae bacterium]|nr:GNAT family N-acetyltransferase [Gaiellaceae bacterium]